MMASPDEFLNRSAVALENVLHLLVIARHEAPNRFGIEALAQLGGADQIGE